MGFWLTKAQSLLYCNEHGVLGFFSEEVKSCVCPVEHPTCQGVIPCIVGISTSSCYSCAMDNITRCGACHHGNILHLGSCRPSVSPSLDHYLNLDVDIPDVEVLLSKTFLILHSLLIVTRLKQHKAGQLVFCFSLSGSEGASYDKKMFSHD